MKSLLFRHLLPALLLACLIMPSFAKVGKGPRIVNLKKITKDGFYLAPRFSPDGQDLLITGAKYRGLFLLPLNGAPIRPLTGDDRAGAFARFAKEGTAVIYSTMIGEEPAYIRLGLLGDRKQIADDPAKSKHPTLPFTAETDDHRIVVTKDDQREEVSPPGDKFYRPQFSPDGKMLMFQGLASGIYVYDFASRALRRLGSGNHPSFSPDSAYIIFDRTDDDGMRLLSGDIFIWHFGKNKLYNLTDTPKFIEERPVVSPDGHRAAFDAQGVIYLGDLAGLDF
jgi:Tol biopolymer transport system component